MTKSPGSAIKLDGSGIVKIRGFRNVRAERATGSEERTGAAKRSRGPGNKDVEVEDVAGRRARNFHDVAETCFFRAKPRPFLVFSSSARHNNAINRQRAQARQSADFPCPVVGTRLRQIWYRRSDPTLHCPRIRYGRGSSGDY